MDERVLHETELAGSGDHHQVGGVGDQKGKAVSTDRGRFTSGPLEGPTHVQSETDRQTDGVPRDIGGDVARSRPEHDDDDGIPQDAVEQADETETDDPERLRRV
jgi:hypothetical protein